MSNKLRMITTVGERSLFPSFGSSTRVSKKKKT